MGHAVTLKKTPGSSYARLVTVIMESEERSKRHVDRILREIEPRLRNLEDQKIRHEGEHRGITSRLDSHRDALRGIGDNVEKIKDGMVVGRIIAWLVSWFRGK